MRTVLILTDGSLFVKLTCLRHLLLSRMLKCVILSVYGSTFINNYGIRNPFQTIQGPISVKKPFTSHFVRRLEHEKYRKKRYPCRCT